MSRVHLLTPLADLVRPRSLATSTLTERSRERYRRAALTTVAALCAQGVATISVLASVPLALNYLGAERYGLWVSANSLVAIVTSADLGIGNGVLNAISEAHGTENRQLARRYVSSALVLLSGIAALLGVLTIVVQPRVSWAQLFNVSSLQVSADAQPTTLVLLGCSFLMIPLSIAARVQMGYQEGFLNSVWQAAGSMFALLGLILAIVFHATLPLLVLAFAGGPVLSAGLNAITLFMRRDWLRPHWSAVRRDAAAKLLRTGLLFAVLQAVVAAAFLSDNLIVARLFGPETAAQYAVHAQLFGLAPLLAGMGLSTLWPAYGEAIARGDTNWVRMALTHSLVATLAVVGSLSLVVLLAGQYLIVLWVGPRIEPSLPLMIGLAAWAVVSSMGNAAAMFLNGAGVLRFQVIVACVMGVAAVLAKVLFGLAFGLSGVIWGTLAAYLVFSMLPVALALPKVLRRLEARARVPANGVALG